MGWVGGGGCHVCFRSLPSGPAAAGAPRAGGGAGPGQLGEVVESEQERKPGSWEQAAQGRRSFPEDSADTDPAPPGGGWSSAPAPSPGLRGKGTVTRTPQGQTPHSHYFRGAGTRGSGKRREGAPPPVSGWLDVARASRPGSPGACRPLEPDKDQRAPDTGADSRPRSTRAMSRSAWPHPRPRPPPALGRSAVD